MSASRIKSLAAAFFGNGKPKNFMTTKEAKALVREAKRNGVISGAEKKALGDTFKSAQWTYNNDDAFGSTKPFANKTLSITAGNVLKGFAGW